MNKVYYTRRSEEMGLITSAFLPGSRVNNIYSPGSNKLTDVQWYMSASCQPGRRVNRAFFDVEKPFFCFLIWRLQPPNQKI